MNHYTHRCAFLSMDSLEDHVCDDDLAVDPLRERGVDVEAVSWRRPDVDWGSYDWVIVRSCWDYQGHLEAFLATLERIAASTTILANPLDVLRGNVDKRYLATLEERGVPIVPTRFGHGLTRATLLANRDALNAGRCVIKPVVSAGSHNTFVVSDALDDAAIDTIVEAHGNSDWMLQPFVDAVLDPGEYSVFLFDGEVSHTILKTPRHGDFRVQEEFGGNIRSVEPDAELLAAAHAAYAAIGERLLYARIDLVAVDGRYCLMEAELIEPSLYLRCEPAAAARFADACHTWFAARAE